MLSLFVFPMQAYAQTHKAQEETENQKPTLPIPSAPAQQTNSPNLQSEHKEHVDADVRVVSSPAKDGYDKAGFWVNLSLVIVALGTGIVIGWQAIETRKAANAALAQIQLMKEKERCELVLSPSPLDAFFQDVPWQEIKFSIYNIGATRASEIRVISHCDLTNSDKEPEEGDASLLMNYDPLEQAEIGKIDVANVNVLRPDDSTEIIVPLYWYPNDEGFSKVRNVFIHAWGRFEYRDIFGAQHFATFHYSFHVVRLSVTHNEIGAAVAFPVVSVSKWSKCQRPEHNDRDKPS
jgi:hypothetical protein